MNFSGVSVHTLVGRLLRWPLQLVPREMTVHIVQGRLRGKKWIVGSSNHGCWLGSYEFEKQMLFVDIISPGSVVFDIGAHVGFYTLLASELVGTRGSVIAFEPSPRNLSYLRKHVQLNHCDNVRIFPVAAGAASAPCFFEQGLDSYTGRLSHSSKGMTISVVALDDLVHTDEIPVPGYMKIDVEGAEFQVLLGARSILETRQPVILLATHGSDVHQQCCQYLYSLGYRLRPIIGDSLSETDEIIAEAGRNDRSGVLS